jgi:hypothetical protein
MVQQEESCTTVSLQTLQSSPSARIISWISEC